MKEQKPGNERDKNDKKTPGANCACTLKTRRAERIKPRTRVNTQPAKAELSARETEIGPTRLRELIDKEINNSIKELNSSIKDAVRTIAKQRSMEEKEPERRSRVYRSCGVEEHCKRSPDGYTNRQTTGHASRRYNDLSSHSNFYMYNKMHENATLLPARNQVNNENKKHTKSANNVNTDNRRMTGNVNIYICSETNDNGQEKKKFTLRSCANTSSDTIAVEQSGSRSASVSSASSCKLINIIQERRKKLQVQQPPNVNRERTNDDNNDDSDDNAVRDNGTLRKNRHGEESSDSSKEQVDVSDKNVECNDTITSIRDDCRCQDTIFSDVDLQRDSSNRANRTTARSSETKVDDAFSSNAICTDVTERRDYYCENDKFDNICENDSEYSVCRAVDGSRWLPKSIYTDCAAHSKISKERHANNCKYRNEELRDMILTRNDIRRRQTGRKIPRQLRASCQREHVTRKWSTCSCIAEEEEEEKEEVIDRYANVNEVEVGFSGNVRNNAKCPEKISVCRALPSELVENTTVRETSFNVTAGKRFEKMQTCNGTFVDPVECPRSTTVCETTFGNSKELAEVTRVCKEFVTGEPPEDIAVRGTMFGGPRGLPEEVTICETAPADSKEAPEETICKIPDSNFASQEDVKRALLNDVKDKFTKKDTNSSNLNDQKENAEKAAQPEDKYQSVKNTKRDVQREIVSNDQSEIPTASLGTIKDPKSSAESVYSTTLLRARTYDRVSNSVTPEILVNQQRTIKSHLSPDRSMENNFQQLGKASTIPTTRDLVSSEKNQSEREVQQMSKHEEQNSRKEIETIEEKPREPLLHRSLKKLIDIIRRRARLKETVEIEKTESAKITADDREDVGKSGIVPETKNKIRHQREIRKKMATPMRPPLVKREIKRKILRVARTKPTPPVVGFGVPEEETISIFRKDRATPKLLRIIAAKRSHSPSAVMAIEPTPQVPEIESVLAEIITNGDVDRKEIPEKEIIPRELTSVAVAGEVKAEDSVVPETSVTEIEMSVKGILKDIADTAKVSPNKDGIPKDIVNEATEIRVTCPWKVTETELKTSIPCKSSDSSGYCACLITKCIKCNNRDCLFKNNIPERRKDCCTHCPLSTTQCARTQQYLKNCPQNEKSMFRNISPSRITRLRGTRACAYCYRIREECECGKTAVHYESEKCKCRRETRNERSITIDKCRRGSPASCINCCRPEDQCSKFALIKRHKTKKGCNVKRAMICLYCDNPRHKCTCRAPIGKCPHCSLPSDVCDRQDIRDREHKGIAVGPDERRAIRVTSWKPKREIERYFERNLEKLGTHSIEDCRCYERPKRQRPEELPYQRLNIFSHVMNELQQKMSEAECCVQCWRNPCRCGSQVNQDEKGRARCYVRCGRNGSSYKRPLAKCYYCKSLPCTCITAR